MSTLRALALSLISGALLAFSWPAVGHPLLLFIAWIPFLWMEEKMGKEFSKGNKFRFFWITCLGMLTWNLGATWWVWNSSPEGSIMAFTANSLLMALVLLLIHVVKRRVRKIVGAVVLVSLWMGYEWFHHRWDLSWPWLTLGNAFSGTPDLIQWYEFTGTPGGTLWAWVVNLSLFEVLRPVIEGSNKPALKKILIAVGCIGIPMGISLAVKPSYSYTNGIHLVAIQPNFDPYTVKFNVGPDQQMDIFLRMAKEKMKPNTRFLLLPETSVSDGIYEDRFQDSYSVSRLIDFAKEHSGLTIVAGASTWKHFENWETPTPTARKYGNDWYEAYNSALWIDSSGVRDVYHKSKLVPGVEQLPYPALFGSLKDWAIDLGGTSGTLGTQEERDVFSAPETGIVAAPVICYESIFGDFIQGYFEKGANAIFVLTNDGWWGDTPGYKQHLSFARLRAIEFRAPVIRCTNTGVSCSISPDGKVNTATEWWKPATLETTIAPGTERTLYSIWGDWLSLIALFLALLSFAFPYIKRLQP